MADKIFADGIYFEPPNQGAPEYVIGKISIKTDKLIPFLERHTNAGGYVNIDIKRAKTTGKPYCELNVYEKRDAPVAKTSEVFQGPEHAEESQIEYPEDDINAEDIPF